MNLISPLIIIIIGVGYLLANLGIISITPWQAFLRYWPITLIWFGLKQLWGILRHRNDRYRPDATEVIIWLTIVLFGVYILMPRIGFDVVSLSWSLIWPTLLIILGFIRLFKKEGVIKVDLKGLNSDRKTVHSHTSFVGELHRSGNWVLDDLYLRHGLGSVFLDLTQAIIPDREVIIDISGLAGEVTIYLPPELPFSTVCYLNVGEITVLEHNESGTHRRLEMQTEGYATATRRLDIRVSWKAGEVKIRRIG